MMEKIKYWSSMIRKAKWLILKLFLSALILFAAIPLGINWVFTTPALIPAFEMDCDTKTALLFYGSILSFAGTMFLGVVAIVQNNRITKLQERAMEKEESCYIVIDERKRGCNICLLENAGKTTYEADVMKELIFSVENFGEAFIEKIIIQMPTSTERNSYTTFDASITIAGRQFKNYSFNLPKSLAPNGFKVEFISNYGKSTFATFDIIGVHGTPSGFQPRNFHFYGLTKPEDD